MRFARSTRSTGGCCRAKRSRMKRRCSPSSSRIPAGARRARPGAWSNAGFRCASSRTRINWSCTHRISWAEDDVDAAVPLLSETLALFPSVRGCSFDRGFHSPSNRVRLDALLDCNALPAKGALSQKAREHEARAEFAAARRQHPAVVRQANSGVDSRCKSGRKEGVTSHFRREPCACHREVSGEVSVAVRVGRASEHRNRCLSGVPRLSPRSKATLAVRYREDGRAPRCPGTHARA